ncbi:MAG: carboxypeptidase-like regulatory domain-containing protein, partial [Rhodothermales bacterium]|nr:carboxypeptidase-like regulatory domain-containing protein [Rhodothermales bacterium]
MPTATTRWLCLLALVMGVSTAASAQGVTSSAMRGSVYDAETEEPLPGANVLATHLPTGTEYGAATDLDGTFAFRNMRVGGPYRLRVTFVGYDAYTEEGIALVLGETYEIDVPLSPAAAELGEVEVVAAGGVFDPNRTGLNTSISDEEIEAAPSLGRDLADFTRLTPQAYVENDDDDGPAISIAGQSN